MPSFLKRIYVLPERVDAKVFPYSMPAFRNLDIAIDSAVTFLVGENGTGKSTLMEGVAAKCGFNMSGGSRNHVYPGSDNDSHLSSALQLAWSPKKLTDGFFLRAETFFNFSTYVDEIAKGDPAVLWGYGGESLHRRSHGEAFLALFANRFRQGLFLLDEPEAALSPSRQLSLLTIIHDLVLGGKSQFIIATHSPLLFSYPEAQVFECTKEQITPTTYLDTEHFQLTRRFLESPERYFHHLFK